MSPWRERGRWPQNALGYLSLLGDLPADPVPLPAAGTGGLVESGQLTVTGVNLVNSGTAAATVTLADGTDSKGAPFATLPVAANTSATFPFPNKGVLLEAGLFATVTGGSVTGTAYVVHWWKYPFTPAAD